MVTAFVYKTISSLGMLLGVWLFNKPQRIESNRSRIIKD